MRQDAKLSGGEAGCDTVCLLFGLVLVVLVCACVVRDMVAQFEAVSMAMTEPDADLDALTNKMSRLQVGTNRQRVWVCSFAAEDNVQL